MVTTEESKRAAAMTLHFLLRSQMAGADADNYIACRNWLSLIASGNLAVASPAPPENPPAE